MMAGIGYDVHRLVVGRKLILGGVEIPYEKGLLGHSDADVLSHAIGDALLGAACLGDLGSHFPPSDHRFSGISSLVILSEIKKLISRVGFSINNVDSTIIIQKPRLAPFIQEMRNRLSQCLETDIKMISIKATTTEGLGFTGMGDGVAAQAIVLLSHQ
ncbi:2-C-methyl-D-erythritol 2,4-cyclodiphosphate synthase [candidate division KSB1 bacterium]|nr:2-C-methyl-D-erythritol 2,4-cyclodiphosphate synthase [candidate division KSB1 bacterium]